MLLRRFHADWVLPIVSPPIPHGWVTVLDDRVVAVGGPGDSAARPDAAIQDIDLGRVAIMPGLVNAHTHIELAWMWGRVKPRPSFVEWVSELMALRAVAMRDGIPNETQAMTEAIAGMEECGTAAVGDISNTLASIEPIAHSRMQAVVFRELIGFGAPDPDAVAAHARAELDRRPPFPRIRMALAPHAPYSVSPGLFRAIVRDAAAHGAITSVHLGETPEELQFLRDGTGPFRDLLERVRAWNPAWQPPQTGPVDYVASLGLISPRTLVVHGVQFTDAELATLAAAGATLVTCPRSNVWVGVGDPPVRRFFASGVPIAIGTDSLASASDLNVFNELAALHHLAPEVPAARLLDSATRVGAEALGLPDLGLIAPGASARMIAIDLPETVREIETYLVEGIDPGQIYWVPV
jgi:cytosine/adenosine deaminase-related metal-dependent hydrolase